VIRAVARTRTWLDRRPLGHAALGAQTGYSRHATSQLAAAISYRMLFSFVPLTAFVASIADLLLPDEARNDVARWVAGLVPGKALDSSVQHALKGSTVNAGVAGLVSLLVLLAAASSMMASIRVAFRIIWENDMRRTYVRSRLLDFALVLGVGLIAVATFGATLLAQVLVEIGSDLSRKIGVGSEGHAIGIAAQLLTSGAVTYAVLIVLYRVVPPVPPRWRAIWLPALLATVAFHIATAVYALYLARFGNVTAVYGPLGAVLGFLLVVYVGVMVVLLGAELVASWPGSEVRD
jgi:membrane protein